jgi:toxin HigB-1
MDIRLVEISKKAEQNLQKIPLHIATKLQIWVDLVENEGLREARKIKSYHDEPLKGNRIGQRSIRLNIAYRAIYIETSKQKIEFVKVLEVNKHDY